MSKNGYDIFEPSWIALHNHDGKISFIKKVYRCKNESGLGV